MEIVNVNQVKYCELCRQTCQDEIKYGKFMTKGRISVHYYCLLLSSALVQNGDDDQGFLGFMPNDIVREARRVKQQICFACNREYANVACCAMKCRKTFHLSCGIENGVMSHFTGTFQSFCPKHVKWNKSEVPSTDEICLICFEKLGEFNRYFMILSPCCKTGWFHRWCLASFAVSAGYFFKCPKCNDIDKFREKIVRKGIFIPDRDAAWELEQNAFAELLERPKECTADKCVCPNGRTYNKGYYSLLNCYTCGSKAIHKKCMMSNNARDYTCIDCLEILKNRNMEIENSANNAQSENSDNNDDDEEEEVDVEGNSDKDNADDDSDNIEKSLSQKMKESNLDSDGDDSIKLLKSSNKSKKSYRFEESDTETEKNTRKKVVLHKTTSSSSSENIEYTRHRICTRRLSDTSSISSSSSAKSAPISPCVVKINRRIFRKLSSSSTSSRTSLSREDNACNEIVAATDNINTACNVPVTTSVVADDINFNLLKNDKENVKKIKQDSEMLVDEISPEILVTSETNHQNNGNSEEQIKLVEQPENGRCSSLGYGSDESFKNNIKYTNSQIIDNLSNKNNTDIYSSEKQENIDNLPLLITDNHADEGCTNPVVFNNKSLELNQTLPNNSNTTPIRRCRKRYSQTVAPYALRPKSITVLYNETLIQELSNAQNLNQKWDMIFSTKLPKLDNNSTNDNSVALSSRGTKSDSTKKRNKKPSKTTNKRKSSESNKGLSPGQTSIESFFKPITSTTI